MLTAEENELLTRVGPGTAMGQMLRRFWIPALISSELPAPDCAPQRVRLLGENFVAFRDSAGRLGFLDEACCHRGASLAMGRCEDGGIRCIYHGWKYGVDGTLLDAPNARDERVKQRIRAKAYPVREAGDIIWAYIGPTDRQPPLPNYAFMNAPASQRHALQIDFACNWLQALEGGLDSSHVDQLHRDYSPFQKTAAQENLATFRGDAAFTTEDRAPSVEVESTDFGFHAAFLREAEAGGAAVRYARIHAYILPFMNMVPPGGNGIYVPIDDTHTRHIGVAFNPVHKLDPAIVMKMVTGGNAEAVKQGWYQGTPENRWLQDRSRMGKSFSGIAGLVLQDMAVCGSMGPIYDRTREHLIPADGAVIRLRRLLLRAVRDVAEGGDPQGMKPSDTSRIKAADGLLGAGTPWQSLVPDCVVLDGDQTGREQAELS